MSPDVWIITLLIARELVMAGGILLFMHLWRTSP